MSEVLESAPEQVEEQIVSEIQSDSQEIQEPIQEGVEVEASTEAELQEEIGEAIEEGASEEEIASMVKQYKLKVNGKEYIKEVDTNDEDAMTSILQREAAGQIAMQEAADLKKNFQQELLRLKQDPMSFLEEMGLDPMELSVDRINKQIELDKRSPEELATEKLQVELKEARDRAEKLEKQAEEREAAALYEQESVKLQDEIKGALDAHATLHASPRITRRVAETMEWAMNNGYDDVTAADVLPTVEAQMTKELNEMFSDLDEKALEKYVGAANLDKMRQKRVDDVSKKPASIAALKQEAAPKITKDEPRKKRRLDDFMRDRGGRR